MKPAKRSVPAARIAPAVEAAIAVVRDHRVMLDRDLAALYGVSTSALLQAVRRNRARFPSDSMFRLRVTELRGLRSQSVISKGRGGRRTLPCVFTEQGVAMLSSVLRSEHAVRVNIEIMRAFVRLRRLIGSREDLARRMDVLERSHDERFRAVFDALSRLMERPERPRRRIGFHGLDAGGGVRGAR